MNTPWDAVVTIEYADVSVQHEGVPGDTQTKRNILGTGFVICCDPPIIATCKHVIDAALGRPLHVRFANWRLTKTIKVEEDTKNDLALIWTEPIPQGVYAPAIPVSDNVPPTLHRGTKLTFYGHSWQTLCEPLETPCSIAGWSSARFQHVLSGDVNHGDSGGPVLRDGLVVGVVRAKHRTNAGQGLAIPSYCLANLAKEHGISLPFDTGTAVVEVRVKGRLSLSVPSPTAVFTGRETELTRLHEALRGGNAALAPPPQALHGMGGVGKTQTAAIYARSHQYDYSFIGWVLGETIESYTSQIAALAPELDPPVPTSEDQTATFKAVLQWFSLHDDWLLIVDNASELSLLRRYLPQNRTGRVLITTREMVPMDFGHAIEVDLLDNRTGATLLLRRAGRIGLSDTLDDLSSEEGRRAEEVSEAVGGLPLALNQAGAYMQERSLSAVDYLRHYREREDVLDLNYDDPNHASVAITFSLAIEVLAKVPRIGKAAVELVHMCAFLAPDSIPYTCFRSGSSDLPPNLRRFVASDIDFGDVAAAACRFSLMKQTGHAGLWMHRLAQKVVRDRLSESKRKAIASRVVLAISSAFPKPESSSWETCDSLLSHALLCSQYISGYKFRTPEAARLLNRTARLLQHRARYSEAEQLFLQSLAIRQEILPGDDPNVVNGLSTLAGLYLTTGRPAEAEPLLITALGVDRRSNREGDPAHALRLNQLARAYQDQGRHMEAEPLYLEAIEITEKACESEHPNLAVHLSDLGYLYFVKGVLAEAEIHLSRSVQIGARTLGESHPDYGQRLHNLAAVLVSQRRFSEAEPLLREALEIHQAAHPLGHPNTAYCLYWLGRLCFEQDRISETRSLLQLALEIYERTLGSQNPDTLKTQEWLSKVM